MLINDIFILPLIDFRINNELRGSGHDWRICVSVIEIKYILDNRVVNNYLWCRSTWI